MIANKHNIYFLGIGGIGMSALARYFVQKGLSVAGYDRVSTSLTQKLEEEGMMIHYDDQPSLIPVSFAEPSKTLVIYTPAIPADHRELNYFREHHFMVLKRSVVLGEIVKSGRSIAVAGTHGKTTISGMVAHIFHESGFGCNAFLGGISVNYGTNCIINPGSDKFVVEADEFDRSFLTLFPEIALITAMDADHLDIYGDTAKLKDSFSRFASQVQNDGVLIIKKGVEIDEPEGTKILSYSMYETADYYASDIEPENLTYRFKMHTPTGAVYPVTTGILGRINVENSLAALAVVIEAGVDTELAIQAVKTYKGIRRRFDVVINTPNLIYIDDYAHHPEELRAIISSVRELFPGKRISGVFQPHLYSRTRDFAAGFAVSLSLLDDVILLDIYPAREEPLEGVSSELIFSRLMNKGKRIMCSMNGLRDAVESLHPEVLLTMGAGDIDKMTEILKLNLEKSIA
jgi:UDP-N-acetylmuramate--alanine ligase